MKKIICTHCGSSNTRKTTDTEKYMGGYSYYCNDCDEYFNTDDADERDRFLAPDTSSTRRAWETDEDYDDRMEDLGDNEN